MKAYLSDSSHKCWWPLAWDSALQEPVSVVACRSWGRPWEPAKPKREEQQHISTQNGRHRTQPVYASPLSNTQGHDHLQRRPAALMEQMTLVEIQAAIKSLPFTPEAASRILGSSRSHVKKHTNQRCICSKAWEEFNVHYNHVSGWFCTSVSE